MSENDFIKSDSILSFDGRCRALGLSVTRQRELVWEILSGTTEHPTADMIYEVAHERLPNLSRMSVFRILDTFCDSGLIRRVEHPHSASRYDADTTRHCHTVCRLCGRTGDWRNPAFETLPCPPKADDGFIIDDYSVTFYGVCPECCEKTADESKKENG